MSKGRIINFCDRIIEICVYATLVVVTFSTSCVEIVATVMIATWLVKTAFIGNFKSSNFLPVKIFLAYWVWTVFSCINSDYPSENFRGILKVGEYALVFLIAFTHPWENKAIKKGIFAIAIGAIIACINGFYQYFTGVDFIRHKTLIYKDYMRRISASFVHPNDFGVYLLVVTLIFLAFLFSKSSRFRNKVFFLMLSSLSIAALLLTKSRGAWVSFAAGFLILGVLKGKRALLVAVALLIMGVGIFPASIRERIFSLTNLHDGTTKERLILWKGTMEMIKVHPVLGFGVNTYSRNFPAYRPEGYPDVRYSHNAYLHMASEVGVTGTLLYLSFLLASLTYSFKGLFRMPDGVRKVFAAGLLAAVMGFFINCAVDTHLYSVTLAVFSHLLLGFCLALAHNPG